MAITILEQLQLEVPHGKRSKNGSLGVIYDLVRKHQAEIEEARDRGYSWKQIDMACYEAWKSSGKLPTDFVWWRSKLMIADCYRAMKNGTTAGKGKKKPLSLEVTVTKR